MNSSTHPCLSPFFPIGVPSLVLDYFKYGIWSGTQYELRHLEWGRNIQSMIFQGEMKLNRVEQIGYSKSILFWEDKNNLLCHTFSLRAEKIPNLKSIPGICQTLKSETYLEQVICQNVVLETSMKNLANSGIWSYKT